MHTEMSVMTFGVRSEGLVRLIGALVGLCLGVFSVICRPRYWVPGRATIPLGSNLGQVVYSHCLPSFSAPRNWGTKGSFRRLSGYGD